MTKREARNFLNSLIKLRKSATDEQAVDAPAVYPAWKEDVDYVIDDRVLYDGVLYKVITEHTSQADWMPDVAPSLFTKVLIPDGNVIFDWEQPESTNPYMVGDKVIYNGAVWVSIVDNNIWKPGEYGWEEVQ